MSNQTIAHTLASRLLAAIAAGKNVKTLVSFACVLTESNTLTHWQEMLKVPELSALAPKLSSLLRSAAERQAEEFRQKAETLKAIGITPSSPEFLSVTKEGTVSSQTAGDVLSIRAERLATAAEKRAEKHAELVESIRAQVLSELETSQPRTKTDKINKVA